MRHFFSGRVKLILVLALVLALLLGVLSALTGRDLSGGVFQTLLTPLRSGAHALTNQAQRFYNYLYGYDALKAENEQLREQLSQWQADAREADSLERENERLRQLLELKDANPDYELVDAYVIARSSADWTSTVTLDRGANSGIETGMCALTANGEVVGLVIDVGSNYCVVRTVLDSSLDISAIIASSGYTGIVTGAYTNGYSNMLRMNYLNGTAVIRNRDQVVTAGSSQYPRNLILGYIVDAGLDDVGVAKYAILEPAAQVDKLEQVFILTGYDRT